jgi:hypothetical protein
VQLGYDMGESTGISGCHLYSFIGVLKKMRGGKDMMKLGLFALWVG